MTKNALVLLLVSLFAAGLTGCGESTANTSQVDSTETQTDVVDTPTTPPPLPEEEITDDLSEIKTWGDYSDFVQKARREWLEAQDEARSKWLEAKDSCTAAWAQRERDARSRFRAADRPTYLEWLDSYQELDFDRMEALLKSSPAARKFEEETDGDLPCEAEVEALWDSFQEVDNSGYRRYEARRSAAYAAYQTFVANQ